MSKFTADCESVQERLWGYIDRELSAPEIATVSAHLKACGDCQRLYESQAREAKLYRLAFVDSPFGESFVERLRGPIGQLPSPEAPGRPDRMGAPRPSAFQRLLPGAFRSAPLKFIGRAALAAAMVAIFASVYFGLRLGRTLGRIEASGAVEMTCGDRTIDGADGKRLEPGTSFELADGDARLRLLLRDGTGIELVGPAAFRVDEGSDSPERFVGHLDRGALRATVQPHSPPRIFRIETPDAVARVVGTVFRLKVEPGVGTSLGVEEGKVWFRGLRDSTEKLVEPASRLFCVSAATQRLLLQPEGGSDAEKTPGGPAPAPGTALDEIPKPETAGEPSRAPGSAQPVDGLDQPVNR